jgi:hypothetical protein
MTRRGIVYIGTTPAEEHCAQTGSKSYDWAKAQRLECRAYMQALKRVYGEPPEGAKLFIASMPHDYGTYREVQCSYDSTDRIQVDYAVRVEEGLRWWAEADMWAPILYHPDTETPFGALEDPTLWDRATDEYVRPRGNDI